MGAAQTFISQEGLGLLGLHINEGPNKVVDDGSQQNKQQEDLSLKERGGKNIKINKITLRPGELSGKTHQFKSIHFPDSGSSPE